MERVERRQGLLGPISEENEVTRSRWALRVRESHLLSSEVGRLSGRLSRPRSRRDSGRRGDGTRHSAAQEGAAWRPERRGGKYEKEAEVSSLNLKRVG